MRAKTFWLILVALGLGGKRHWHILAAIVLGVFFGVLAPRMLDANQVELLRDIFNVGGQLFIRLISMIVIPLVVSSLVVGVSSLGDTRQLGRMGGKVLAYFLLLMTMAAILGAGIAMLVEPGLQVRASEALGSTDVTGLLRQIQQTPQDLKVLFFEMIPTNPVGALATADLVPVIIFTLFFGAAVASIGEAGRPIISFFEALFSAIMKITDWIMILAVPGIFCLTFVTVSVSGVEIFRQLSLYGAAILLGLLIQVFVIFPLLLHFVARIDFMNLYRAISEAIMVAFGTASSSATLPITIACTERRAGVSNRIASFVLPTGATINKTGTTMFEVIAALFLIQAYNIPFNEYTIGMIVLFAIIASIGAAGVPSAGMFTLYIVLNSSLGKFDINMLAGGMALLWSIDRLLDMCRTVVNVISSCTVAALVAASEGELNRDILNNHEAWTEVV